MITLRKGSNISADQITDHPERFLVSEMIREKVLQLTREEIPHSVAVVIDEMKRDEDTDKIHIRATIMVERDSQKGIVIGKQGSCLRRSEHLPVRISKSCLEIRSSSRPGLRLRKLA